jgi:hypothetical protein
MGMQRYLTNARAEGLEIWRNWRSKVRDSKVGDSKLEKLWAFGEPTCILHPLRELFART